MQPTLIRVDADEATYSLHVIVRFGLEQELLTGSRSTADLPEAWNARYAELLGVTVPNDRLGVLQDVHWSAGLFGYFPTYALGNVIGLQIWDAPAPISRSSTSRSSRGELGPLHDWLREHVYRHGRTFTPRETARAARRRRHGRQTVRALPAREARCARRRLATTPADRGGR